MKKLVSILLLSVFLLIACGNGDTLETSENEENNVDIVGVSNNMESNENIEEIIESNENSDNTDEEAIKKLEEAYERAAEEAAWESDELELEENITFEDAKNYYFYHEIEGIDANIPEIEVMSDTDELVGLYYLYDEYKYKDNMLYKTPERQYIEINNDGTFTMYEYREPDIVYEGDTDSAINLSLERFLESTPDVNKEGVRSRNDVVYNYFLEGSYYIDKNNNVNQSFDNLTPLSDITVISGYLKQEYGEINLQFLDYVSFNVTNNQDGETDFLIIVGESPYLTSFNKTSDNVLETERLLNIPIGEPSVTLFNKESFQRISMNEIPFEFMIKDNKLKSANQLQTEVNIAAQERENLYNLNESEHGTGIYIENHNELYQYLHIDNKMGTLFSPIEILNDTSGLIGYTKDNRELQPEIAFSYQGNIIALFDEGEILTFNEENSTWEDEYYTGRPW